MTIRRKSSRSSDRVDGSSDAQQCHCLVDERLDVTPCRYSVARPRRSNAAKTTSNAPASEWHPICRRGHAERRNVAGAMSKRHCNRGAKAPLAHYANYFEVGHNLYEFFIDFGQFQPEVAEVVVHTRIAVAPTHAKAFTEM